MKTLCRYKKFIYFEEKKTPIESFVQSKSVSKIENVQERAPRILLNNYTSDYETLLDMSKKSSVFARIHRTLAGKSISR